MMTTIRNTKAIQLYQLLLSISIAVFCFAPKFISPAILVMLLFTIYHVIGKKMSCRWSTVASWFVLFYLCYVFGLFFTDHFAEATKNLERRMVYVLFPLLFSFRFKEKLNLQPVIIGFISGLIICSILGLFHSYTLYQQVGDFNNSFGSSNFSYIHHPTYLSAFFVCAFWMAREGWKNQWSYFTTVNVTLFFLFTLVMQFFCFSFAGLLFLFVSIMYLIFKGIRNRFPKWVFYTAIICSPFVPVILYFSNIHIQIQVDELGNDVSKYVSNPHSVFERTDEPFTGNKVRLIMWTVAAEEIWMNPMGAGTSNFDDVLGERLKKHGLADISSEQFNPHNQMLQVGVEHGVIGLLVFLALFFFILKLAWKQKNYQLLFIVANLIFNMLFESMLQRQSGIVFYTFWILLLSMNQTFHQNFKKQDLLS